MYAASTVGEAMSAPAEPRHARRLRAAPRRGCRAAATWKTPSHSLAQPARYCNCAPLMRTATAPAPHEPHTGSSASRSTTTSPPGAPTACGASRTPWCTCTPSCLGGALAVRERHHRKRWRRLPIDGAPQLRRDGHRAANALADGGAPLQATAAASASIWSGGSLESQMRAAGGPRPFRGPSFRSTECIAAQ